MSAVAVSPSGQAPRATRRNHTWLEDLVHGCFTVAESAAFVVCYVTALASAARGVSGLLPLLGVAVAVVVIVRVRKWQASVWDHQRALAESTDFLAACIVIGSTLHNIQMLWYEPGELLPDLGHSLIPEVHPGHPLYALSDALADFVYPVLIVYVLFFEADSRVRVEVRREPCDAAGGLAHAGNSGVACRPRYAVCTQIARLNCMRVGAVHLLRGLVVIGTSLPGPALHCRAGAHLHVDVADGALALFTDMGQVLGLVKTCGDLIFSGHAATLMVQLLLMYVTGFAWQAAGFAS